MAIKSNTIVKLQDCSLGVEHSVAIGQIMAGHAPVVPALPTAPWTYDTVKHLVLYARPADAVMGLFDPGPHVNSNIHAYCTGVQIRQNAGVAWSIALTSGDASEGSPTAPEVHDPDYDLLLASGTGSAYTKLNQEILPGQRIRVVLGTAAVIPSRVIAMFCNTIGAGGRLIG
jgi:hypothetical protein